MHKIITTLARAFAIVGGVVLTLLIVLTCLSILGRSLNSAMHSDLIVNLAPGLAKLVLASGIGPINGDFELVEAGMAFAIFAFLPLCQLNGAHASVDLFTSKLSQRANRILRMIVELIFAATLILIAVQLFAGMESKRGSGQTSFLLQYPVWWGYAISVPGAIATAIVSVHIAISRLIEVITGRVVLPSEMEAEH